MRRVSERSRRGLWPSQTPKSKQQGMVRGILQKTAEVRGRNGVEHPIQPANLVVDHRSLGSLWALIERVGDHKRTALTDNSGPCRQPLPSRGSFIGLPRRYTRTQAQRPGPPTLSARQVRAVDAEIADDAGIAAAAFAVDSLD